MGNKNKFFGQFTGGGSGSSVTLKTNNVNNSDQSILNLTNGSGIGIVAGATGLVTISNTALANPVLKTANVNNSDQSILNLTAGSGIGIVAGATGLVTISNTALANPVLKTANVNNSDQSILNLTAGSGIGIVAGATGLVTISNTGGGGSVTLQTNSVNNASQTTLNLTQGAGILITDLGGGNVNIQQNYSTLFRSIATQNNALPINTNGNAITWEIELPNINGMELLWELESRFYKEVATDVDISVFISTTSGTIGTLIAKGSKFTGVNDLSAINRTFYNVGNTILKGLTSAKFGTPTDYEPQTLTNNIQSYAIDSTIPQFIQFVVSINDSPVPVGAFAVLDFCKFTLTKVG